MKSAETVQERSTTSRDALFVSAERWRRSVDISRLVGPVLALGAAACAWLADGAAVRADDLARAEILQPVIGQLERARSVAGSPATAEIRLTPAAKNADGEDYAHGGRYSESDISGQTLTVAGGGFWSFWHVEVTNWDPAQTGSPLLRSFQGRIDAASLEGSSAVPPNPGADLTLPVVSCTVDSECRDAFNSADAPECGRSFTGICDSGWINEGRSDWLYSHTTLDLMSAWGLTSPMGPLVYGTCHPTESKADDSPGFVYYAATLALYVPPEALGTYTLTWVEGETFLADIGNDFIPATSVPGILTIDSGGLCGDNVAEFGEECDGTDDSACPGRCRPPGGTDECTCAPVCGDDVAESGEECDGTDDVGCPGLCYPAGHSKECACAVPEDAMPEIRLTPVALNADGEDYAHGGKYSESDISGQTLTVYGGGFWSFWHVEVTNWDPAQTGSPLLRSFQGWIDALSLKGSNAVPPNPGADLTLPVVSCVTHSDCRDAFNSAGLPRCNDYFAGECNSGWINEERSDWLYSHTTQLVITDWGLSSPSGLIVYGASQPTEGRADDGGPGYVYYAATLALYVPPEALGTYTITWLDDESHETFFADPANMIFPVTLKTPGVLTVNPGPECGNDVAEPGEECDGTDSAACTGVCHPPGHAEECTCGPLCGNDVVESGEECDGTNAAACTGVCHPPGHAEECTCGPLCGNDLVESGEMCDGTDDASCPGLCRPPGDPEECTCEAACGNDVIEDGEECDGTDDTACPGLCYPSGHPKECACAVAEDAMPEIRLTPAALNADGEDYAHGGKYSESDISGQTLTVAGGGFWSFWHVEVTNWDPAQTGSPLVRSFQGRIVGASLEGSSAVPPNPGADLTLPVVPCTVHSDCREAFNSAGLPLCSDYFAGACNSGWINEERSDWLYSHTTQLVITDWGLTSPTGPLVYGASQPTEGRADDGGPGYVYYAGTLALYVPPEALGTYTITWDDLETFLADPNNVVFPVTLRTPGVLTVNAGPACGNDEVETGEECDGTDDANCPGLCGQHCNCGNICGDGLVTGIEECDGTNDAMCLDGCRPPGHPDGECTCVGYTPPPAPEVPAPDALCSDWPKNRYISMMIPSDDSGRDTAIRVRLTSLHPGCDFGAVEPGLYCEQDSDCPRPGMGGDAECLPSVFPDHEGFYRWVNRVRDGEGDVVFDCPDSEAFDTTFKCAVLGCYPEYRDWAGELGGEVLHVTGASVVPSSRYDVAQLPDSCQGDEGSCTAVSAELSVFTSLHADVDPASDGLVVLDVGRIVDKIKDFQRSPVCPPMSQGEDRVAHSKPVVHLYSTTFTYPDPLTKVGVLDVAIAVDALKGKAFSREFRGPAGSYGPCADECPGEPACPWP